MYLGVHVSISGKIYESVDRAQALGCTVMQIFSRSPRQWRSLSVNKADAKEFRRRLRNSAVKFVAVHIPYLVNLATSYDLLYKRSIEAYIEDIRETALLGADYLVTHMGSFKNSSMQEGLARFTRAVNVILRQTQGLPVKLLLENTAGSGSWLGATFQHHEAVFKNVKDRSRLGVCLDTAHVFAAGHNIGVPSVFDSVLREIDVRLGKRALKLIHLNDSLTALASHSDRHEHIGRGFIGLKGLKHIVNHPRLCDVPYILETPKNKPKEDMMNLDRVRSLVKHGV